MFGTNKLSPVPLYTVTESKTRGTLKDFGYISIDNEVKMIGYRIVLGLKSFSSPLFRFYYIYPIYRKYSLSINTLTIQQLNHSIHLL